MKIVVLDDSSTILLTIQALLEELDVLESDIILFKDGNKALSYIEKNGADIIFSDIWMPNMNGFEFVKKLLALSEHFVSSLFIVTANEHSEDINKMREIGAKRFIKKPINAKFFNHFIAPEIAKHKDKTAKEEDDNKINTPLKTPNYADINFDILAGSIGIRPKSMPLLVESFLSESLEILCKLDEAIEKKELQEIKQLAHSIKGSAGNMKFDELYEMARAVEFAAQAHDEDFPYQNYCNAIKIGIATIPNI